MQNDAPILRLWDLPTRSVRASTQLLRKRGPMQVVAIPGSQFQKGGLAVTGAAQQSRLQPLPHLRLESLAVASRPLQANCDLRSGQVGGPASGARRDTKRKRERTSRSCTAR